MCTWKWPVCLVCHWCAYAWRCARWKPSITLWISSLLALLVSPPYQHHSHHRHLRSRSLANAGVLLNTSTSFIVHCAAARSVFSRTYTYTFTLMCILLSVLWCCWLIGRKGIQPVKNTRVVGCWRGYLSGASCRLAYGPADATAIHCLLLH